MTKPFLVTSDFYDAETGDLVKAGTTFEADEEREEVLRAANVIGKEAKTAADSEEWPKHVGGGTFELSNGERIKGKEAAEEAEEKLKAGEVNAKTDIGADGGTSDTGGGKEASKA
ncbi:hypothetical protein BSK66_25535 [Paenibacillus odorifer]|uniref:hypothetical protein n=1 Tax=Paenibacillus TaxID=44249 RepID=UPI0003E24A0E|nr:MULTISPECIES: hypothetical protein [Paenibacillus]ETT46277.1 hypothetical protein C171_28517 [Paenibacillus sp. FSL H8-237]OME50205.1 hypothetical protein BSK66_25535 [Paenibacillus odorifer]